MPADALDDAALGGLRERVQAYMRKAIREAKEQTSWISPDPEYEGAVADFVDRLLGSVSPNPFLSDLRALVARLDPFGRIKRAVDGAVQADRAGRARHLPGLRTWNLCLVDPDNRRPPDHDGMARRLAALAPWLDAPGRGAFVAELAREAADGRIKTWLTMQCLALRARSPSAVRATAPTSRCRPAAWRPTTWWPIGAHSRPNRCWRSARGWHGRFPAATPARSPTPGTTPGSRWAPRTAPTRRPGHAAGLARAA